MRILILGASLISILLVLPPTVGSEPSTAEPTQIFARIDGLTITRDEFESIFQAAVRHKYYHGRVPRDELARFRKQVADDIIVQTLVYNRASQLGMRADRKKIDAGIDAFDRRNAANPGWQQRRDQVIPRLVERLERQDLIERLEARVRDIPVPDAARVRQYYLDRPEKFTEPERMRLAVILVGVAPSADEAEWRAAESALAAVKRRLDAGEAFAALAARHSDHPSAANGGDLGYLHQGVLETRVQQTLGGLDVGALSEPLRVLEGVALFRLDDRQPAQLKSFDEVERRAASLLRRELQDAAWKNFVDGLRSSALVYVDD